MLCSVQKSCGGVTQLVRAPSLVPEVAGSYANLQSGLC